MIPWHRTPDSGSLQPLLWVGAALAGGLLLHVDRVPLWATAAALVCIGWRLAAEFRVVPLPGRYAKIAIALLLIAAVLLRFRTLNGLSAGTTLLIAMGAIKLLETRTRRERYIVVGCALFLLLAACLDRENLTRAPLYLLHAWLCCAALAAIADEGGRLDSRATSVLAARTLALALPLALLLFVFFPRLAGAFWVIPQGSEAVTGLADTMSPGSISQLSEYDDPAFRVRFESEPPRREEFYWRGPVLHDFDGYTWTRGPGWMYWQTPPRLEALGPPHRYQVSLEPHARRWWFALDTVDAPPDASVRLTYDHQLLALEPVTRLTTYTAISHTRTRSLDPLPTFARRYDTKLDGDRNLRSLNLALQLRARASTDRGFVDQVLAFFRTGGFEYTLTPPKLDRDSIDDFLFNTRRGFCGHFASAFVTLMRAGGLPARVVTGYLGGEWNPAGGYYIVRQSDAHAWAEVWLEGTGWTRIDPTAVVAPERLRRGIFDLIPDSRSAPARLRRSAPWLTDVLQRWDALNEWWDERVVRFNFKSQLDLLRALGIDAPDWEQLGWAFTGCLAVWLVAVAWYMGRTTPKARSDRLARAYVRLCRKLAQTGVQRAPHEGPLTYAAMIGTRRPDLAAAVHSLFARYADLRYGNDLGAGAWSAAVAAFERAVGRLRIGHTR